MVLELKVPHMDGVAGLYAVIPTLGLCHLFAFTGIYWINHHHLVHRTEEADELVLYANLFFLFWLSLLPFFTSYVLEKKLDSFSVFLYIASMIFTGFSFLLLRLSIARRLRIANNSKRRTPPSSINTFSPLHLPRRHCSCLHHPHVALGLCALVTVIWITPTAGVKPREPGQTDENAHFNRESSATKQAPSISASAVSAVLRSNRSRSTIDGRSTNPYNTPAPNRHVTA